MAGLNSVGFSNREGEVDLERLRIQLRKMNDKELARAYPARGKVLQSRSQFCEAVGNRAMLRRAKAA